ncbi:hypothetical protein Zmor_023328 [Zophobas morio]|uniref:Uncharacterized protein n=1 Tax=Zophobas morio TaxID=2755281 RepID=A0AA38I091_9CUCU|nr:hypothetical protein Zmor_023328 [Zophobas morio]
MVYSVEQNTFTVISYYRNETFVNKECVYSVNAYKQEYLAKHPDLIIQETTLMSHIRYVVNRFVRTGSVDTGKSPGRSSVSEEVVNDLRRLKQNPQTYLTKFPQQQEFLFQHAT